MECLAIEDGLGIYDHEQTKSYLNIRQPCIIVSIFLPRLECQHVNMYILPLLPQMKQPGYVLFSNDHNFSPTKLPEMLLLNLHPKHKLWLVQVTPFPLNLLPNYLQERRPLYSYTLGSSITCNYNKQTWIHVNTVLEF